MTQLTATVSAHTEEIARQKAAQLLNIEEGNISLSQIGENLFFAQPNAMDAAVTIDISEDRLTATIAAATAEVGNGTPLTTHLLDTAIKDKHITVGLVSNAFDTLKTALDRGTDVTEIVVANGRSPQNGEDGKIEFFIQKDILAGMADAHSNLDFHERGFIHTVRADQLLAAVTPATQGIPGIDVLGRKIPARPGAPITFNPGENIRMSTDRTRAYAGIDGMVRFANGTLSVTSVFEYAGDIDYQTGNIHMDKGSVLIRGSISPDFEVAASGNVVVEKPTRRATITAGGDVEIRQGLHDCTVTCGGNLVARYAQNCKLKSATDIVIANNLHNCTVISCLNVILTTGKGVIRGGQIHCTQGVEAKEIGIPSTVDTLINLGLRTDEETELLQELADIDDALNTIDRFIGNDNMEQRKPHTNNAHRTATAAALAKRDTLKANRTDIAERLTRCRSQEHGNATVKVHQTVHPGTRIVIEGREFKVERPMSRSIFFLDTNLDRIVVQPL